MTPRYLTSTGLSADHGFFGRDGGVSTGPVAGLNTGFGGGDRPEHVAANRERARLALGADALYTPYQTHSAIAAYVAAPLPERMNADAVITDQPGIAVGVVTADCVPILFEADGWVGAAHAGWRGSLDGIVDATISLFAAHHVPANKLRCAIGPALRSPLFEVGSDLRDAVTARHPDAGGFFAPRGAEKFDYDHIGFVRWRLMACGILPEAITDVGGNTLEEPQRWFSYRASRQAGHDGYGRNLSAITCPRG